MIWPFREPGERVLIVCSANICRSPAAAVLLRFHLKHMGAGRRMIVESAGTDVAAPGAPADPRMVALAAEKGLKLGRHHARPVDEALLAASSRIWVMEARHRHLLLDRWSERPERVALLHPDAEDVPDPYFGSKAGVRDVFEALDLYCCKLAAALSAERSVS